MGDESRAEPARVLFSGHAVRRMFEHSLDKDDVRGVVRDGGVIADYPDDNPYPSCLLLGLVRGRPVHVVFARGVEGDTGVVVTVYEPAPALWSEDFRTRRRS